MLFFFFRNWNARKKGWTGPLEVQGETSLAFQLGMWTSEKDSNLSLHKVRPIEAMMMMLMTIKTYRVVRKFSVSKCWPKCWERERCMRCMTIDVSSSVWVICPVKNRCKSMSTYLLCSMFQRLYVSPSDAPTCKIGDQTFFVVDLWDWDVVNKTLNHSLRWVGVCPFEKKIAVNLFPHLNLIAFQKRKKGQRLLARQISKTGYQDSQISAPTTCVLVNPLYCRTLQSLMKFQDPCSFPWDKINLLSWVYGIFRDQWLRGLRFFLTGTLFLSDSSHTQWSL